MIYISTSVQETERIAADIGKKLKKGDIVAFRGPMGAGKTTFTRGLAKGLGINAPVSSPTYAIVNEYRGAGINLYHMDMYRVSSCDDLNSCGFSDYLDMDGIVAVEWSEKIQDELGSGVIYITLRQIDENTREIIVEGNGDFENTGG